MWAATYNSLSVTFRVLFLPRFTSFRFFLRRQALENTLHPPSNASFFLSFRRNSSTKLAEPHAKDMLLIANLRLSLAACSLGTKERLSSLKPGWFWSVVAISADSVQTPGSPLARRYPFYHWYSAKKQYTCCYLVVSFGLLLLFWRLHTTMFAIPFHRLYSYEERGMCFLWVGEYLPRIGCICRLFVFAAERWTEQNSRQKDKPMRPKKKQNITVFADVVGKCESL